MYTKDLLTVITPTYNRANFLVETIQSILSQTYENFEYLIIDDGSTDKTEEIIKPFLTDNRVKYFKHPNMGESKTTNRGYHLASGELSVVINSDDPLYRDDYFSFAVKEFEKEPDILAVYPDWINIDSNSNILGEVSIPDFDILSMCLSPSLCLGPGMMIRTDVLRQLGFRDESISYTGDLDISMKLARLGRIKHVNIFGATHRDHPGNAAKDTCKGKIAKEILNVYLNVFREASIPKFCFERKKDILKNALTVAKSYANDNTLNFSYLAFYSPVLFNSRVRTILFFRKEIGITIFMHFILQIKSKPLKKALRKLAGRG